MNLYVIVTPATCAYREVLARDHGHAGQLRITSVGRCDAGVYAKVFDV